MQDFEEGQDSNNKELEEKEKEKLRETFYEKQCCYKEGILGYIYEMLVIAITNIVFLVISIGLNNGVLFKKNNYINLVKNSSNSLSKFEKFWCYTGNFEFIGLIIYLVFSLLFIITFIITFAYLKYKKKQPLNEKTIINSKILIIVIYFCFYILFYLFFSYISYWMVYSIIFISISPIEYPGIFNIANKSKNLTLDEEIEIEDAVEEFKKSKFFHILYIIILFIILYLNILIRKNIYKSIIFILEKYEKKDEKKDEKEDEKNLSGDKNKQQKKKQKKQKEYNWEYPDINQEFKFLEGFYLGIFLILHLSISLLILNIFEEESYQKLILNEKNSILNFKKIYTIIFFFLNCICFAIIIALMSIKMLYDNNNILKFAIYILIKLLLFSLNIIHFIGSIVLIILCGLCLSSLKGLDKNENMNYFVVKKTLVGQIIVNSFILFFLIIIIIDNIRLNYLCCSKKKINERVIPMDNMQSDNNVSSSRRPIKRN